ncbi:segregation/condensation protein A, partial [Clostridium autoethanogenum]
MNLYVIKIYEITVQYLHYLKKIIDLDLDVVSEFIVIA